MITGLYNHILELPTLLCQLFKEHTIIIFIK